MPFGMTDHGGISGFLIFRMVNLPGGYRNHPKSKLWSCNSMVSDKLLFEGKRSGSHFQGMFQNITESKPSKLKTARKQTIVGQASWNLQKYIQSPPASSNQTMQNPHVFQTRVCLSLARLVDQSDCPQHTLDQQINFYTVFCSVLTCIYIMSNLSSPLSWSGSSTSVSGASEAPGHG